MANVPLPQDHLAQPSYWCKPIEYENASRCNAISGVHVVEKYTSIEYQIGLCLHIFYDM